MKVFVANLPEKVTRRQIRDLFEKIGPVDSVDPAKGGGAFVQMTFSQHGIDAVRLLNGSERRNQKLHVGRARRTAITKARELFEQ